MNAELITKANNEIERGKRKWGHVDQTPQDFMIAIQEEIGEVAHAINHHEGYGNIKTEIAEVVGLLSRLYDLIESE